jgi:aspartyl-tRNA(Asn)/glutamyl-tRNA(Gln) amidotransferase subunit C
MIPARAALLRARWMGPVASVSGSARATLRRAAMAASKIDRDVVLHVAKLASLSLSEGEVGRFVVELARIVAHVEQLEALDTRDVPPTAHVQVERIPLRKDEVTPCLSHEEALSQAPRVEADGFAVPAFLE